MTPIRWLLFFLAVLVCSLALWWLRPDPPPPPVAQATVVVLPATALPTVEPTLTPTQEPDIFTVATMLPTATETPTVEPTMTVEPATPTTTPSRPMEQKGALERG